LDGTLDSWPLSKTALFMETVSFDDTLHGFLPERGTPTAIIKAKLKMDSMIATEKTMYHALLQL
jgi:hypothetical protein